MGVKDTASIKKLFYSVTRLFCMLWSCCCIYATWGATGLYVQVNVFIRLCDNSCCYKSLTGLGRNLDNRAVLNTFKSNETHVIPQIRLYLWLSTTKKATLKLNSRTDQQGKT